MDILNSTMYDALPEEDLDCLHLYFEEEDDNDEDEEYNDEEIMELEWQ
jgi:hypothetical protein